MVKLTSDELETRKENYKQNKQRYKDAAKKWKKNNPESVKISYRKTWVRRYGITWDEYVNLYNFQEGKCVLCGMFGKLFAENKRDLLVVDHCHFTKRVRGLLCHSCNTGIGMLKESPEIMMNAISYLHG